MGIIRVPKSNFTTIENVLFKDKNLSLKTKGLFCYMVSKKDGWVFSIDRIANESSDGRESVRSGIKELEKYGYLTRKRINDEKGYLHIEYILNYPKEDFILGTDVGLTDDRKPDIGLTDVGKPDCLIKTNRVKTNKVKKEEEKNNIDISNSSIFKKNVNISKSDNATIYSKCMELYNEFIISITGVKPNITSLTGKSLKSLISYFSSIIPDCNDDKISDCLNYIFTNFNKWDVFHQKNLKLEAINSNIINIINSIKNGNSNDNTTRGFAKQQSVFWSR